MSHFAQREVRDTGITRQRTGRLPDSFILKWEKRGKHLHVAAHDDQLFRIETPYSKGGGVWLSETTVKHKLVRGPVASATVTEAKREAEKWVTAGTPSEQSD